MEDRQLLTNKTTNKDYRLIHLFCPMSYKTAKTGNNNTCKHVVISGFVLSLAACCGYCRYDR